MSKEAQRAGAESIARVAGDPSSPINHIVQFYEDDAFLCDTVARFIGAGMAAGEAALIIATDLHRHAFVQRLRASDFDVERAIQNGRLTLLDARETLERFLVDRRPDGERFQSVIGELIDGIAARGLHIRAYGEMVDLLWRDGNADFAVELEKLWNQLGQTRRFSLLCAYTMGNFYKEGDAAGFDAVCRAHAHVLPAESYAMLERPDERLRVVSSLQQRARALEHEIDVRKQLERQLAHLLDEQTVRGHETEQRFRLLVESVSDCAIFMLDPSGHVTTWNAGAERIKGYRASEIIGRHFSRFYPDEDAGKCTRGLQTAAREGHWEDEGWRVRKDGTRFWANVVISRISNASGELIGFAKVTRDLTQRRALEAEREARAAAEAELTEHKKLEVAREQLLGVVGHDLRNPLAVIAMSAATLLKRGHLIEADAKIAARIARNSDYMSKMISQLLDFTRARLGSGIPIERKPMDVAEVAAQVVADCEIANPDRVLSLDIAGDVCGNWDRERLAQVLGNLIGNAVQYGQPDAPIAVRVAGRGEQLVISVHNQGAAIPADLLATIFDPFRRGNARPRAEGLGLGLFIVREIARAHGGEVSVQSSEHEGTTFFVELPRA